MADSEDDICVGAVSPEPGTGMKRKHVSDPMPHSAVDSSVEDEIGHNVVVAILASNAFRWKTEFMRSHTDGSPEARKCLLSALGHSGSDTTLQQLAEDFGDQCRVVGIAVVQSWRMLRTAPTHEQSELMIRCLQNTHQRCKHVNFLQHEFLACATLDQPVALDFDMTTCRRKASSEALWSSLLSHAVSERFNGSVDCRSPCSVASLLQAWQAEHKCKQSACWPLWAPLASAVSSGKWRFDVTACPVRQKKSTWRPPLMPSRSKLRKFKSSGIELRSVVRHGETVTFVDSLSHRGEIKSKYSAEHLINAVEAADLLKVQGKLETSVCRTVRFFYPNDWERRLAKFYAQGHKVPKKDALIRVRYDVASMACRRWWN